MHNPYRGGTADVWYSHRLRDHWVEYKYIATIPKKANIVPALSPLQLEWLRGRSNEGRDVSVVVGHPKGGVVFYIAHWEGGITPVDFVRLSMSRMELADWISS